MSEYAGIVQDELRTPTGAAMTGAVVIVRTVDSLTPATVYNNPVLIASAGAGDLLVNHATTGLAAAVDLLLPGVDPSANYTFYADSDLEYDLHVVWQGHVFDYRVRPKVVKGGDVSQAELDAALTAKADTSAVVLKSLVDAAGDLIVGTADNTVARLAKGSALQGLRVNAAGTGLEYASAAAGGVQASDAVTWAAQHTFNITPRYKGPDMFSPEAYGAVADNVTDCSAAFAAMTADIEALPYKGDGPGPGGSAVVKIGRGKFYLGTYWWKLRRQIRVEGVLGRDYYGSTWLRWAAGTGGILIESQITANHTSLAPPYAGQGDRSVLSNLCLDGTSDAVITVSGATTNGSAVVLGNFTAGMVGAAIDGTPFSMDADPTGSYLAQAWIGSVVPGVSATIVQLPGGYTARPAIATGTFTLTINRAGVTLSAPGNIEDCHITRWCGDGVNADTSPFGSTIVNMSALLGNWVYGNRRNGLHIRGSDSNQIAIDRNNFVLNKAWGILDESLLGNVLGTNHFASNGTFVGSQVHAGGPIKTVSGVGYGSVIVGDYSEAGGAGYGSELNPTTLVLGGGIGYQANPADNGTALTTSNVGGKWLARMDNEARPTRRWVYDGVTSLNSKTVTSATIAFTSADAGKWVTGLNIPAGARIEKINSATSADLSVPVTLAQTEILLVVADKYVTSTQAHDSKTAFGFWSSDDTTPIRLRLESDPLNPRGWWTMAYGTGLTSEAFAVTNSKAAHGAGRFVLPRGFFMGAGSGDVTGLRLWTAASALPTSGTYRQGDRVVSTVPASGGREGWTCVSVARSSAATPTGNFVAGSLTVTSVTNLTNLRVGDGLAPTTGLPRLVHITAIDTGAATVTLSDPALLDVTGGFLVPAVLTGKAHLSSTGDLSSGSATVSNVTNPSTWANGDSIKGTGIPANATILSGGGTATLTLSANATATNTGVALTDVVFEQFGSVGTITGVPTGAAGGDLGGTYPDPTVTQARGLKSATTTVAVSAATAPTTGQVLTATGASAATWQTPAAAGSTIPGLNPLRPNGALSETFWRQNASADAGLLASGRLHLAAVWLETGTLITSITFVNGATAAVTPTNQWFALYNNAASPALLRQTIDDLTTAWVLRTPKTLALTSTFTTTYSGIHYLGIMVAAGTVPNFPCSTSAGGFASMLGIAPATNGPSTTGLTTTAPSPAAAPTASGSTPYAYCS